MMGLIRIAATMHTLVVWLTLLVTIIVAWSRGGLGASTIGLICVGVVFQTILGAHDRLRRRAFPLQRVLPGRRRLTHPHLRLLLLWAVVPLPWIAARSAWVGALWLGGLLLLYAPDALSQIGHAVRRNGETRKLKQSVLASPPEVVVFIAGPREAAYQINQWLPVLERLPFHVAVLSGSLSMVEGMQPTNLPVFFAASHAEIEWFLSKGTKIVLYPANPVDNARPLRQYQLHHFFINHGESDKAVNQSKLLMAYDKLLVGGPLAERRLQNAGLPIRPGQVVHVGRPQAELLLEHMGERTGVVHKILYAPTWEGLGENVDYSSVSELGVELVQALSQHPHFEVRFKPHPFTGTRKPASRQALSKLLDTMTSGKATVLGDMDSLHEAMNWSDILITDVSSVLNEYLVTAKPIVLCNARGLAEAELHREHPSSRAAYILDHGPGIVPLIESISGNDTMAATRREVRRDSLGEFEGSAMDRFTRVLEDSLKS